MQRIDISQSIIKFYENVELLVDVILLNDIPFVITILENIYYRTVNTVNNMKCILLEFELQNIVRSYSIRWFRIIVLIVDIQLKVLKDRNMIEVLVNIVA